MAVYTESFATSGFAGAGFKQFVNDKEINTGLDSTGFTEHSYTIIKTNAESTYTTNPKCDEGGFATGGFATPCFRAKQSTQTSGIETSEVGSNSDQVLKKPNGFSNNASSSNLFKPKFVLINKVEGFITSGFGSSALSSNNEFVKGNYAVAQKHYYSDMDTSDDFSAAELLLRYDALTGSYSSDTCIKHKSTEQEAKDCPQCCLAKYVLKIGSGRVELVERVEEGNPADSEVVDKWQEIDMKKECNFLMGTYSPY